MEVTINVRHGQLTDSVRNQAVRRFSRFERIDRRLTAGTLVIEPAAHGNRAEARLIAAGASPMISHAEAATLRAAIDAALDRVERQLKRRRKRHISQRTRGVAAGGQEDVMP